MKSVGKQLQEARLAKSWTPELAARETKIKAERIRDLESDDYSHFSSPTYARGFVRTYARALGVDEYRLLRQLDNKLPEDDNASFVNETGLPYIPEPSQVVHASSAHRTGLYIFLGLGLAVVCLMSFVLVQAYRAGELPRYFATSSTLDSTLSPSTNGAPVADTEAPLHALPVDPNDTTHAARAQAVDLNNLSATDTNSAPAAAPAATPPAAPTVVATAPAGTDVVPGAPRALPVDPASLTNAAPAIPAVVPVAAVPAAAPAPAADSTPIPSSDPVKSSARASGSAPVARPPSDPAPTADTTEKAPPRALPVSPAELIAASSTQNPVADVPPPAQEFTAPPASAGAVSATNADGSVITPVDLSGDRPVQESMAEAQAKKRLVLTASRDSFIRVTALDPATGQAVLYASVLRAGQSLAFGGHKFSVNVGVPSAVDIALDGVNYGPHSDGTSPETFTIESRQP